MSDNHKQSELTKSSRNLSLSTLCSRVLGMFREMLMADIIGGGLLMSAWVQASTIANMFRRVLGEGALAQALVPLLVHAVEDDGEERGLRRFSTVFVWLTLLLTVLTLLIAVPAYFLADQVKQEQWRLAFRLLPVVMPYAILIGIVGLLTALSNSRRMYFLPSLTAILQNVVLIAVLYRVCPHFTGIDRLTSLAWGLLAAGVLEVGVIAAVIVHKKWYPRFDAAVWRDLGTLKDLFFKSVYGMIGAGALQMSLLFDRYMASWVGDYAPAALYNSDRLVYLPIGVFAVAFGTVSLTEMSRCSARKEYGQLVEMICRTMRVLLFITIPIGVFMLVFGRELVTVFYYRGAFNETALQATAVALSCYSLGIPAFAALKISLSGFYAQQDMKTPLKVSLLCIAVNVALNTLFILVLKLGQGGIAAATALSAYLNNALLLWLLNREFGGRLPIRKLLGFIGKMLVLSGVSAAAAYVALKWLNGTDFYAAMSGWSGKNKLILFGINLLKLIPACIVFGAGVVALSVLTRVEEVRGVLARVMRRRGGNQVEQKKAG